MKTKFIDSLRSKEGFIETVQEALFAGAGEVLLEEKELAGEEIIDLDETTD